MAEPIEAPKQMTIRLVPEEKRVAVHIQSEDQWDAVDLILVIKALTAGFVKSIEDQQKGEAEDGRTD